MKFHTKVVLATFVTAISGYCGVKIVNNMLANYDKNNIAEKFRGTLIDLRHEGKHKYYPLHRDAVSEIELKSHVEGINDIWNRSHYVENSRTAIYLKQDDTYTKIKIDDITSIEYQHEETIITDNHAKRIERVFISRDDIVTISGRKFDDGIIIADAIGSEEFATQSRFKYYHKYKLDHF